MSELIGQMLGQYQITAVLGEGGMATVYRAHQLSIKRDVAIKVIESKLARNPEFVKRFEREAQTVASLDHPHILKVFDFGQQGNLIYLVMELKTGGTLSKQIATRQLPLERISELLTQIGAALDYAHGRGIIHRDLKPQNVLLDEQGNAFLTDFGIAKLIQPDYTALTQTGAAMGTPAYMSPEQWQGRMLDARSDLYALGIMLYEMLTGQVPFRADTPASMMFAHLQETPPPLHEVRADLPRHLEPVVATALSKSPDARFQTAKSLADAFRDALNGKIFVSPPKTPITPNHGIIPPSASTRRGISLPLAITGAMVLILAVVGGLFLTSQQNNPPTPSSNALSTSETHVAVLTTATPPKPTLKPFVTETSLPTSPTPTATASSNDTLMASPTESFTPDVAHMVASVEAQQTAAAIVIQTLTATVVTHTPTPDTARTNVFTTQRARAQTVQAQVNQTTTATKWTTTPIPVQTLKMSSTESFATRRAGAQTAQAQLNLTALAVDETPQNQSTALFATRRAGAQTAQAQLNLTALATHGVNTTATLTPDLALFPTLTSNQQWAPKVVQFDGVAMVLVPPGCFNMGYNNGSDPEKPVHRVCITKQFYLDRFEVTNAQFSARSGSARTASYRADANLPRENITWLDANLYCLKRGGRLPTEAEWEYAARGPDNLLYPWGNRFAVANTIYRLNSGNQTAEVGINLRPDGRSWVGAYDMSGNVWEWVIDYYHPYPFTAQTDPVNITQSAERVVRGGGWSNDSAGVRATNRNNILAISHYNFLGFRCARPID
ncbi:MAG: SUMF1/EgtB/PvdO family nonheme iron enzyme [Anaerolineae bacterium]|nr:SUMF1/EgtB/PvdO family nonheme iron enzyme [Anaerolineae bacterium]